VPIVLDVSAALSWVFTDERDAEARAIARAVLKEGAVVPALWVWEIQNALTVAQRRGRISSEKVDGVLRHMEALPIEVDVVGPTLVFKSEVQTSRRFNLSAYDAAYLDLALRRRSLLATRDGKLAHAADALKIRWRQRVRS